MAWRKEEGGSWKRKGRGKQEEEKKEEECPGQDSKIEMMEGGGEMEIITSHIQVIYLNRVVQSRA